MELGASSAETAEIVETSGKKIEKSEMPEKTETSDSEATQV
jgi:hypothetical protein